VYKNWFVQTTIGKTSTELDEANVVSIGDLESDFFTVGGGYSFPLIQTEKSRSWEKVSLDFRPKFFGKIQHNDFDVNGAVAGVLENQLGLAGYQEKLKTSFGVGVGAELASKIGSRLEIGLNADYSWLNAKAEVSTFNSTTLSLVTGSSIARREDLDGLSFGFTIGINF